MSPFPHALPFLYLEKKSPAGGRLWQYKADGYIPVCAEPYGQCAKKSVASPQDGTTAKQTSDLHRAAKQAWQFVGDEA